MTHIDKQIDGKWKTVASSKNLEVITRYGRQNGIKEVQTFCRDKGEGDLIVYFSDGAEAHERWNTYNVLEDWVNKKVIRGTFPRRPLAFGYGYDPKQIENGIKNVKLSHKASDDMKLYEFTPKLPYRLFVLLANVIEYECKGSVMTKKDERGYVELKDDYFVTNRNYKGVVTEINKGIERIFKLYKPMPKYDERQLS